jgi:hypothetical protein
MPVRIWNQLPDSIKEIENYDLISILKQKLKLLLLENLFYDMHEYFSCKFV